MGTFIDITGKRYGRLIVDHVNGRSRHKDILWECKCDCGNTHIVKGYSLRTGACKSCGCLIKEQAPKNSKTRIHGMYQTRLYNIWDKMRSRCNTKTDKNYRYYGARGICVCQDWDSFQCFAEWAKSSGYQDDLSIERIDVNGNYCPSNCAFIPMSKQARNKTTTVRIITNDGGWISIIDVAAMIGVSTTTAYKWHKHEHITTLDGFLSRKSIMRGTKRSV